MKFCSALFLFTAALCRFAPAAPVEPYETDARPTPTSEIDRAVAARLAALGLEPAPLCSDAVFIRRAFLDVLGVLPTPPETRNFLRAPGARKRETLIDRLLTREEFADYWANKWSDLLRIKAEFPINLWPNAAQAYHRWVRTAIRDNLPYDQFARELLTASGSNFRVGSANFYRALQSREPAAFARTVALTFMGARAEKWPDAQLTGLAMCFRAIGYKGTGEWKEEIVFFDPDKFPPGGRATAIFPDGTVAPLTSERDPREVFAAWLIRPENPWFARALVNRAWYWLLGRGIVHEPDDLRPDNPPVNPPLLAALERSFVASDYNVKELFRTILNSQTYQRSSLACTIDPLAEANFAHYALRRLDAEVLIDALNQITGTHENYSSAIPEPYTFIPERTRATALPDGSITSAFLEAFGRPARDTGIESERNNAITANQRLLLLNSSQVRRKLEQGPKLQAIFRGQPGAVDKVDALYLAILSRHPTDEERAIVAAHFAAAGKGNNAAVDLAWALVNSAEFLHRH
ncbi:MAG: hypothetical protein RIQ93_979 [Verrucomicrobiota bacterium]|jgi:hypothetical protein